MVAKEAVPVIAGDVSIQWDAFLDVRNRAHVDTFRRVDWPNIKRDLRVRLGIDVGDIEPHWTDPGRACFWQEQIVTRGVDKVAPDGSTYRVREERNDGWKTTLPLPANNPMQIAHWLGKGLRLRPPLEGVQEEALEEVAPFFDEPQVDEVKELVCRRHPEKGPFVFATWRAYLRHLNAHDETPEVPPPPDVIERMTSHPFYCTLHDVGFDTDRGVEVHIQFKHRPRSRHGRPPKIEDFKVKKEAEPEGQATWR